MKTDKLNLKTESKTIIWFPPEVQKSIKLQAVKENLSMWRYIAMLHNNYKIFKNEK